MLDIGWTELLVIAIVLIVVVGPKDLPPMLRAFGKMTKRLRSMAGEFRQQFDEALREAELDDVRKTFSDAQKLNPVNSLKDALNPLRQMGNDIRNDLQSATRADTQQLAEPWTPGEPQTKLPDEPPIFPPADPAPVVDAKSGETPASRDAAPQPAKAAAATSAEKTAAETAPVRTPRKPRATKSEDKPAGEIPTAEKPAAPRAKRAPKTEAVAAAASAPVAVAPPAPAKPAARKAAASAAATPTAAPSKQKKPAAAKPKKTGDA